MDTPNSSSNTLTPRQQAHALPHHPGVYIMHNQEGKIIYVGKAKDLKNRVCQYFLPDRDIKTKALVSHIAWIEYNLCANEYEALLLENNLIKHHMPKYNIDLKDGKSYPMIRITHEDFPRVFKTRRKVNDHSKYYGPFPSAHRLDEYIKSLESTFSLRRCGSIPMKKRKEPCLYYHMNKCPAPCCGRIDKEEYAKTIHTIQRLLEGRNEEIKEDLEKQMAWESRQMNYEKAAEIRDKIKVFEVLTAPQVTENVKGADARDYIAVSLTGTLGTVAIMQLRNGSVVGRSTYNCQTLGNDEETLLAFLVQYYSDGENLPNELYVSHSIDRDLVDKFFSSKGLNVKIEVPRDGRNYRILRMAELNAARETEKRLKEEVNEGAVEELQRVLGLERPPRRIEGFDIAQLSGKYTVASLISFVDGVPDKDNYRIFNIQSLEGGIDDFGAMREAASRRYKRVVEENLPHPDLIMIDGGLGQVNAVRPILDDLGLADVPVVGLAKAVETIVFDNGRPDLVLPHSNEGLRLLIAVRDECHRFATTRNQLLRSKDASFSVLESVPGMGPKRAKKLLEVFGGMEELENSTPEEISRATGIPEKVCLRILSLFA